GFATLPLPMDKGGTWWDFGCHSSWPRRPPPHRTASAGRSRRSAPAQRARAMRPRRPDGNSEWQIEEIAYPLDRHVRLRMVNQQCRVAGVMTLAHEDGRDARAPDLLDCREEPDLVVDQHVASGRIAPLDVLEL